VNFIIVVYDVKIQAPSFVTTIYDTAVNSFCSLIEVILQKILFLKLES